METTLGTELTCAEPLFERAREEAARAGLQLMATAEGLALTDAAMVVRGDFSHLLGRARPGTVQRELVVKAAKVKGVTGAPRAFDATAGLGDDSFLLAAAGFDVVLYERNPVIAALLADALERAANDPALADIASRMHAFAGDSTAALASLPSPPDVILLDPMFPTKQKNSAVKKKLQLLQKLERPCDDENALIQAAFNAHPRKVLVKRPAKGPHLANRKPSYTLTGKAIRYDCYALAPHPQTV